MKRSESVILPGSTICILGGGQLGKMTLQAAHRMGYHTIVWAPEGDNPAMEMATHRFLSSFDDRETINKVINLADVITTEWENIPLSLLEKLETAGKIVRPSSRVLAIAQSRNVEKTFAESIGAHPTPWVALKKGEVLSSKVTMKDLPVIMKTDRLGYDGKGQSLIDNRLSLLSLSPVADFDYIFEKVISLDCEISVLVARNASGKIQVSPAVVNRHKDGILAETKWSRDLIKKQFNKQAGEIAIDMAKALDLEGVLAIEFFVTNDGELLFNEMAPRPHNSFHGSIEAAYVSQFEQHVRSICNLPLGSLDFHTAFEMRNLINVDRCELASMMQLYCFEDANFHFYGKLEARPGRKMGHVTKLGVFGS